MRAGGAEHDGPGMSTNDEAVPSPRAQARKLRAMGFVALEEAPPAVEAVPAPIPPRAPAQQAARRAAASATAQHATTLAIDLAGPALGESARREKLDAIAGEIAACRACHLCEARTRTVPGTGTPTAELMFIGEGPGAEEDKSGEPFVGAAGQLLTKIIAAMTLSREQVFIANIVKCRPPGNRTPTPDEMAACVPYLGRQIAVVRPRVIVTLGMTALRGLFPTAELPGITRARGQWMKLGEIDVMPTLHPAYLLRNPAAKRDVWADVQAVMKRLGIGG